MTMAINNILWSKEILSWTEEEKKNKSLGHYHNITFKLANTRITDSQCRNYTDTKSILGVFQPAANLNMSTLNN